MSDLRTELDKLTDQRLDYVLARSRVNTDSHAIREAGMSRSTFYAWSLEEREHLNELAQRVKREAALRAMMVIQDAAEAAAQVKVSGLRSKNEHVKQDAATEILDRTVGKAVNKTEVSGSGGSDLIVRIVHDDDENATE